MRKTYAILVLLIIAFGAALCCCDSSLASKTYDIRPVAEYRVYVCGAVSREGYCTVSAGTTYNAVIERFGIVEQTVLPSFGELFIDRDVTIAVDYYENGKIYSPVNVNGEFVAQKIPLDNVPYDVVCDIADYIAANGSISDKSILQDVLGERFHDVYYKFFVDEDHYEKTD